MRVNSFKTVSEIRTVRARYSEFLNEFVVCSRGQNASKTAIKIRSIKVSILKAVNFKSEITLILRFPHNMTYFELRTILISSLIWKLFFSAVVKGHIFRKTGTYLVFKFKISILYLLQYQNVAHNNMGEIS